METWEFVKFTGITAPPGEFRGKSRTNQSDVHDSSFTILVLVDETDEDRGFE